MGVWLIPWEKMGRIQRLLVTINFARKFGKSAQKQELRENSMTGGLNEHAGGDTENRLASQHALDRVGR